MVKKMNLLVVSTLLIKYKVIFGCLTGEIIYPDGSCRILCTYLPLSPALRVPRILQSACSDVCAGTNKYLYQDNSCSNICNSPMIQSPDFFDINHCDSPCLSDQFYDPSISDCVSSCTLPFVTVESNYNACPSPTTPSPEAGIEGIDQSWTTNSMDTADYVIERLRSATLVTTSVTSLIDPAGILIGIPVRSFSYVKFQAIYYSDHLVHILHSWSSTFVSAEASPKAPSKLDEDNTYKSVTETYFLLRTSSNIFG